MTEEQDAFDREQTNDHLIGFICHKFSILFLYTFFTLSVRMVTGHCATLTADPLDISPPVLVVSPCSGQFTT